MDTQLADLCGLTVTCKSLKAIDLYNTVLEAFSQSIGFLPSLNQALQLDPDFTLARCMLVAVQLEGGTSSDSVVSSGLEIIKKSYNTVLEREKRHIDAVLAFSEKNIPKALDIWNDITVHYPQDKHAMRFAFECYLATGEFEKMRNLMSRAVHYCPKELSIYPYVLSLYAFSLEETNQRDLAEQICRQSIAIQPKNPWGVHTMCHVIEEEREVETGVDFVTSCRSDWKDSSLNHHIAWHLMLYYLDLNQIDNLFQEFDDMLVPNLSSENSFALLDASAILWRLNVLGIDPGEKRWELVLKPFSANIGRQYQLEHSFMETHLMMSLAYGKISASSTRLALAKKMIKSIEEYAETTVSSDCKVADMLGVPLCNALLAYGEERFSDVVALIVPLKYDIIKLGGSWAQRQVYLITLIQAAIKAEDYVQAMACIVELKAQKPHNKTLQRLQDQVLTLMHEEDTPAAKRTKIELPM